MSETIKKLYQKIQRIIRHDGGQDLVEYGLAVAMIALVCISGVQSAAGSVNNIYGQVAQALDDTQQTGQQQPAPSPTPHHHHGGGGGGWGWWHH